MWRLIATGEWIDVTLVGGTCQVGVSPSDYFRATSSDLPYRHLNLFDFSHLIVS
jgi:hypothetical protein